MYLDVNIDIQMYYFLTIQTKLFYLGQIYGIILPSIFIIQILKSQTTQST